MKTVAQLKADHLLKRISISVFAEHARRALVVRSAWVAKNRKRLSERSRRWELENPEKRREVERRYRRKRRNRVMERPNMLRIIIAILAGRLAHHLAYMRNWRLANPERKRQWDIANRQHCREYDRARRQANPEHERAVFRAWSARRKEHLAEYKRNWNSSHPEACAAMKRRQYPKIAERIRCNPHLRLSKSLAVLIRTGLRKTGKSRRRTMDIVGCDRSFFKKWVESNFLPGMSFSNRRSWNLDHVFPTSCCGGEEDQVLLANHYRNLKPVWGRLNREKQDKLTEESIVSAFVCGITNIHLRNPNQASAELLSKAERIGFTVVRHY